MTDAALTAADVAAKAGATDAPLRAARRADLPMIHTRLIECIQSSPYYSDEFKAYESGRLTLAYLEALFDADPWHVAVMQLKGEPSGFMISGPELGTLWLYWTYVFPEKRKSQMIMLAMRRFVAHWDNGRFHKIATYTKHGNDAAVAIMERFAFTFTATLKQHIFGEDYLLYEHPLTKTIPGYDHGAQLGRMAQLSRRLKQLLGR